MADEEVFPVSLFESHRLYVSNEANRIAIFGTIPIRVATALSGVEELDGSRRRTRDDGTETFVQPEEALLLHNHHTGLDEASPFPLRARRQCMLQSELPRQEKRTLLTPSRPLRLSCIRTLIVSSG